MKTNLKIHLVSFFILLTLSSIFLTQDSQAQWTQVSYNFYGKMIRAFASSGDTVFAGVDGQGIYVSTNKGSNWLQTSLNNQTVYCIKINGSNLYVGTGSGVYLSTNRGVIWTNVGLSNIYGIALSGNTIFAANYPNCSGVYLSTNNGVNWIQTALNNRCVRCILISGSKIFAGTDGDGLFFSSNNGISWGQSFPYPSTVYSLESSGDTIYAGTRSGLFRSTDIGISWTGVSFGNLFIFSIYKSANNLFVGTGHDYYPPAGVFLSTNNGSSWNQTSLNDKTINAITISGNIVFAGGPGIFLSSNNGSTWVGPPPTNIGVIKQSGNNLYAGATDGVYSSTDGGLRWNLKNFQQNVYSVLVDGSNIYAGTAGSGVYLSTNDGANWIQQTSLPNLVVNSLAKKDSYILAATSTNGVYYTTNNGTNWTQSSLNITTNALYVLDSLVYAGTIFGGVYKSSNNGVNWIQTSLIYLDVNSFIAEGNKLYAGTTSSGVYYTTNQGANWTQTSMTTNTFVSFSTYGSTVFGGTNSSGVYMTKNSGINWTQTNDGMGNQNVRALHTYGNYIIAGTGGSGFWRRYILEFAPIRGDANLDSAVNVLDVTADVNYILGNPPVPFSTLAADVNTDLVINVLDVVGTVNIILHPTFKQYANKENNDISGSANLYIQNNNLKMFSTMPVKGIQFNLTGAGAQNVTFAPSSVLTNYQVVSGAKLDTAKTFIIFTMSDTSLSAGNHTLGTFTGLTGGIVMNQVFISDENGNGILTSGGEYENTEIPKEYSLQQNYPNPFNPVTIIGFQIPKSGITSLKIYDVTGRLIKTLINEFKQAGNYKVEFDAGSVASGVYFYKLTSGDFVSTRKMVVLK
jgi:hypothetical protein